MNAVIILKGWIKNNGSTCFPLLQLYYNTVKISFREKEDSSNESLEDLSRFLQHKA